jgi:hypothetical protein
MAHVDPRVGMAAPAGHIGLCRAWLGDDAVMSGQDERAMRSAFQTYARDLAAHPVSIVGDRRHIGQPSRARPGQAARLLPRCGLCHVRRRRQQTGCQRCIRLGAGVQELHTQIQVIWLAVRTMPRGLVGGVAGIGRGPAAERQ